MGRKTLKQLLSELLAKPSVQKTYEEQAPDFAFARALVAARASANRRPGNASMQDLTPAAEATGTEPAFRLKLRQGRRRTAA